MKLKLEISAFGQTETTTYGTGTLLFYIVSAIILLALNALGWIDWSWRWLTAPLWAPIVTSTMASWILLILRAAHAALDAEEEEAEPSEDAPARTAE